MIRACDIHACVCVTWNQVLDFKTYPGVAEVWVLCPEAGPHGCAIHTVGQNNPELIAQSSRTQLTVVGAIVAAPDLEKQYPVGKSSVFCSTSLTKRCLYVGNWRS